MLNRALPLLLLGFLLAACSDTGGSTGPVDGSDSPGGDTGDVGDTGPGDSDGTADVGDDATIPGDSDSDDTSDGTPSDGDVGDSDSDATDSDNGDTDSGPPACTDDELRCATTGIERCVDGAWSSAANCPGGCTEHEGQPACACTTAEHCGAEEGCAGGVCTPRVCTPGAVACDEGRVVRCDEDGLGETVERECTGDCAVVGDEAFCTCAEEGDAAECDEGEECTDFSGTLVCLGDACEAGTTFCDGDARVVCSSAGRESSRSDCAPLACDGGACRCTDDEMCGEDRVCNASGNCVSRLCEPNALECIGTSVRLCDDRGASASIDRQCPPGTCEDGACACSAADDCFDGEECTGGTCACASGLFCGADNACCPPGWICDVAERCDADGVCENVPRCIPDCGEFDRCGEAGDECCTSEQPLCGAENACVADCGGGRSPCGAECCDEASLCIHGGCRAPGSVCERFTDCDFGEYCEEALGRCLPLENPDGVECREEGEFEELEVRIKWDNTDDEVISTPTLGDVTGDGVPNLVYNASRIGGADWVVGEVVILDGRDGTPIRRIPHNVAGNSFGSQGRSNIALGDVSGNGVLDIVYASRQVSGNRSWIVAADGEGNTLWRARDRDGDLVTTSVLNGAITVARFGADERAWTVAGAMLIDPEGRVVFNPGGNAGSYGSNSGYTGGVAVVADLTMDGFPEISIGHRAYTVRVSDTPHDDGWPDVTVEELWSTSVAGGDGYTAVADMYGDGRPEVVLVGGGRVHVLDGATGDVLAGPIRLPGPTSNNRGGPPTVADFDGDGRPEIGVAGGHYYTVFDLARPGEDIVQPEGDTPPEPGELFVRWRNASRDLSSNATGSSVFDFQGDGAAEVIYADECFMRVYDGRDGTTQLEIMNSTGTIIEYPIVVDVDGNGRSEIVIVANIANSSGNCAGIADYVPRRGIYVYEDPNDRWVRTRSIWNQHAYSINNINDDGSMAASPDPSWLDHNTFRSNRQGEVPLNAPDPRLVSFTVGLGSCPSAFRFNLVIENAGLRSVPAGMPIRIVATEPGPPEVAVDTTLDAPLLPGERVGLVFEWNAPAFDAMSFRADINDIEGEEPFVFDCNPGDTTAVVDGASCY